MLYNLDINFLKDRGFEQKAKTTQIKKTPSQPIETKIPLIVGGVIMVVLPLTALGYLLLLNQQKTKIEAEILQIDGEISQLQSQNESIQQMEAELSQFNAQINALVSVFNQIKPFSALLEDIRDLTPPNVQIESINQTEVTQAQDPASAGQIPKIELNISGYARSYNDVNDFLLVLQSSDFLSADQTRLESARLVDNPIQIELPEEQVTANVDVELPEVVQYRIKTEVNELPASDLLANLTDKGAVGLVTRIRTLQEKGLINP